MEALNIFFKKVKRPVISHLLLYQSLSFDLILTIAANSRLQLSLVNMLVCDLPVAPNMCLTDCATHFGARESHILTNTIFPPLLTSLHNNAVTRCHVVALL